jgi:hypothetical protein
MGSSPGNNLLQKCRERLRTYDLKWSDPVKAGATCIGLPFYHFFASFCCPTTSIAQGLGDIPSAISYCFSTCQALIKFNVGRLSET